MTVISTFTTTVTTVQACLVERDEALETKWYEIYDLQAETEDGTQSSSMTESEDA